MARYAYKDIERAVLIAGFKQDKGNGGSHIVYRHPTTGLMVTLPRHNNGISPGVAESVLEVVVLQCRLAKINIGSYDCKLSNDVHNYILKHHQKCKENPLFLIPEDVRDVKNIKTTDDVKKYLVEETKRYEDYQKQHKDQQDEHII